MTQMVTLSTSEIGTIAEADGVVCAIALEDDLAEVAIVERYYVEPGTRVAPGDPVALLRTARYVYDLPATAAGIVVECTVPAGDEVELGTPLLRLEPAEHLIEPEPDACGANDPPRATPLARKLALAHGFSLAAITGSGCGGRIRAADVRALLGLEQPIAAPAAIMAEPAPSPILPPAPRPLPVVFRELVATVPRALTAFELDLERIVERARRPDSRRARRGRQVTLLDHLIHAAAMALLEHPNLHSAWTEAGILMHRQMRVQITSPCAAGWGDILLPDAAGLSPVGIARVRQALEPSPRLPRGERGSEGERPPPTFAIVDGATTTAWWREPEIDVPCSAVLTLGAPRRRPVVVAGSAGTSIAVHQRMIVTLAYDARHLTQTDADAFLRTLRRRVESRP